jgi:hypothetical protein
VRARIICETPKCKNHGKIINTVIFPAEEEETFYSNFGQGSEDPEDVCSECGILGVLQDPNFDDFDTSCPYCHVDGRLRVIHFEANTDIRLCADGFATTDAKYFNTAEEVVHCEACGVDFPLSEVCNNESDAPAEEAVQRGIEEIPCIQIAAKDWLAKRDVKAWVNSPEMKVPQLWCGDIFTIWDDEEGPASPVSDPEYAMPLWLWNEIKKIMRERKVEYAIVRLMNED